MGISENCTLILNGARLWLLSDVRMVMIEEFFLDSSGGRSAAVERSKSESGDESIQKYFLH